MNREHERKTTRREALCQVGTGMGMLGLFGLLGDTGSLGQSARGADETGGRPTIENPLAPRRTHFPAKARHVIHIYLNGGPSQVDTFDPKPLLKRYEARRSPKATSPPSARRGPHCRRRSGSA